MGPSGSGKSTLLYIIGCLKKPSLGRYYLDGELVSNLTPEELARVRNRKIGFVFQSFNLLPRYTALRNVELPLIYAGVPLERRHKLAGEALNQVGLGNRLQHRPGEMSGGECQRVAIARALVNNPPLILADEPTGNLDSEAADEIMNIIQRLNDEDHTVVLVTHDRDVAGRAKRIIYIKDGYLLKDQ